MTKEDWNIVTKQYRYNKDAKSIHLYLINLYFLRSCTCFEHCLTIFIGFIFIVSTTTWKFNFKNQEDILLLETLIRI